MHINQKLLNISVALKYFFALILWIVPMLLGAQTRNDAEPPNTRILFVFDGSQSMAGIWNKHPKIDIARSILIHMVDSLEQLNNVQLALRVYGHQSPVPPQDCHDTRLEVPFGPHNSLAIKQKLRFITPRGTTPIAYSLEQAANDFEECENCRNIIILITDGIEACEGDPCAVSDMLQRKGIVLKPFVIGIGMDEDLSQTFDCMGTYYNAPREEKFKEVLDVVISQALDATTAQVNLLDANGYPTETNVNMTFYDRLSGKILRNYMHTLNNKGNPDTLILDPMVTYRIVIHTIPKVVIDSARVLPGKHTIIAADAPQGTLLVTTEGLSNQYRDMQYIVRLHGKMNTLNRQKIDEKEKYITGLYDLEIPTIPQINIDNIEIKQSHTTTVKVPRPGIATFLKSSSGYGSLYIMRKGKMEWVYNLNTDARNETLMLQPGSYKAVFRAMNAKQTVYTIVRSFDIWSGRSLVIEFH
ncbi:MAG TPA: vWA domain-containing protein [Bacteroidales bacterium]|nr:vWA domain-containing protein [Bacteroidales bacterium]